MVRTGNRDCRTSGFAARITLLAVFIPVMWSTKVLAQDAESDPADVDTVSYGTGAGLQILLTNSGFGLGGYYQHSVSKDVSLTFEMSLGSGKDEREVKFFSYIGRSYIPNKANYLLMLPISMGIQHRLFREAIVDNFRPYLQVTAGPTFGWEYPYFKDCDGDGRFDESVECEGGGFEKTYDSITSIVRGAPRFGFGGIVAVGAHFGSNRRLTQGVRIGYAFSYFFKEIELLDNSVENGVHRHFGSPTISLTFGRLF